MIRKLTRIHPASVVAMLALFVALSGVSYAAVSGKIGTKDIKNGALILPDHGAHGCIARCSERR